MKKILYTSILMTAVFAGLSPAQEEQERDPFFSEGPRSSSVGTLEHSDSWGRDPFTRPFGGTANIHSAPETRARGKKLTGIIYGKDVHLAIMSGEVLREGSMVGDQKLVAIGENSVVLKNSEGSTEEVVLENFSIRK
jgi:hypothetical protein